MPVMDSARASRAAAARAGKNRAKGKGHPTTGVIEYSGDEWEFMRAIEDFKRVTGRKFPTWAEVFRVLLSLGYKKSAEEPALKVHRVA
ncbi:hypothetical protein SAMN05444166_4197 [Singulisphaera sp. GP187]|nr:hypothetical protein SAMN05444166_4197 [Singulisphaera sp. GP187]